MSSPLQRDSDSNTQEKSTTLSKGQVTRSVIRAGTLAAVLVVVVAGAASPILADNRTLETTTVDTGAQSSPDVSVSDITIGVDESGTAALSLSSAPNGLSGFTIVVSTNSTATATITDASVASQFSLTNVTVTEDNSSVRLKATDLNDNIGPGAADVRLGSIEIAGKSAGQANLTVNVERLDDDDGSIINAPTDSGVAAVQDGDSGESDPTVTATSTTTLNPTRTATGTTGSDAPGFGAVLTLGGLLSAVILALRRSY